jgi:hypothetical protein
VVEYGGGIHDGPAGQVASGSGGGPDFGGGPDIFASVGHLVDDATNWFATAPTEQVVLLLAVVFLGLVVLRRAF